MLIAAIVVLVFGVYLFFLRRSGQAVPPETQELGGRIGRSVQSAVPLPGLTGQPGAHMMPERLPDEIGPEEEHIRVVGRAGDRGEEEGGVSTEEVRAQIDRILAEDEAKRRRPR